MGKRYKGNFWGLKDFTLEPLAYLAATALLIVAAVAGRKRQLARL